MKIIEKNEQETDLMKGKRIDNTGLFIQCILGIAVLYFAISYFFLKELLIVTQILLALLLLTMSYNNHTTYRRKGFTVAYFLAGLLIICATVYTSFGI